MITTCDAEQMLRNEMTVFGTCPAGLPRLGLAVAVSLIIFTCQSSSAQAQQGEAARPSSAPEFSDADLDADLRVEETEVEQPAATPPPPTTRSSEQPEKLGEIVELPDWNLRIRAPGPGWQRSDKALHMYEQQLAFYHRGWDLSMTAEVMKIGDEQTLVEAIEMSKDFLVRKGVQREVIATRPYKVGKYEGVVVAGGATDSYAFLYWHHVHNGLLFRLRSTGRAANKKQLSKFTNQFWSSFQIIDEQAVYQSGMPPKFVEYKSQEYGFRFKPPADNWTREPTPEALEGMGYMRARGSEAEVTMLTLSLLGKRPSQRAVRNAVLETQVGNEERSLLRKGVPFKIGNVDALRYSLSHGELVAERIVVIGDTRTYSINLITSQEHARRNKTWAEELLAGIDVFPTKAMQASELEPAQRFMHGHFMNSIGAYYNSIGNRERAASYYLLAHELVPAEPAVLGNLAHAAFQGAKPELALPILDRSKSVFKNDHTTLALYALLLLDADRRQEALDPAERAFRLGNRSELLVDKLVALLVEAERWDRALRLVKTCRKEHDRLDLAITHQQILSASGKHDAAVALAKSLRETFDATLELDIALINALNDAARYDEKLQVANRMIAAGDHSAAAYFYKGEAEYQLKRYKQSQASLEEAHRLAPSDASIETALMHVAGMLGKGSNALLKERIAPVSLPRELVRADLPSWQPTALDEMGAYFRRRFTAYKYDAETEELLTTEYFDARIVNKAGVSLFRTIERSFDPLREQVYVNALRVRNEQGEVVMRGNVDDYFVMDDTSDTSATHDKIIRVPIPGIKPGYQVEFVMTKREATDRFPYHRHLLAGRIPMQQYVVLVRAEPDDFQWITANGVEASKLAELTYFERRNILPYKWEPKQEAPERFLATVHVGSPEGDWAQLASDYLKTIEDRLPVTPRVREQLQALVEPTDSDEEKVVKLAEFVRSSLRYQAIAFGPRARIPNDAETILDNRYGDCKDHSLLLYQLLAASDIPAQLALVNSESSTFVRELPSLEQFNHMIVYLPTINVGRFIDCTNKSYDLRLPIPLGLDEKTALLLDDKPRLVTLENYHADQFLVTINRIVDPDSKGAIDVQEQVVFHDYLAGAMREAIRQRTAAEQKSIIQSILADSGKSVELRTMQVKNLEQLEQPFELKLFYRVKDALHTTSGRLVGRLPANWEHYLLASTYVEQRTTPFREETPLRIRSQVAVKQPVSFDTWNGDKQQSHTRFANWELKLEEPQRGLARFSATVEVLPGRFEAIEYTDYHQTMENVRSAITPRIHIEEAPPLTDPPSP